MSEERFDVVVAGCGVAGLSAAACAAENGARVAVLERAPREERGGQSRYTEAYLRMKSESEVSDDFMDHFARNGSGAIDPDLIMEADRPRRERAAYARALSLAEPEVIEALAENAGPTIAWLKGMGVRFDFLPTQFLTRSQPRLLPVGGGQALVDALAARAESLGVSFYYETTAQRLALDSDGGITGLWARSSGRRTLFSGKVVLGCGGFEGNAEMQTRYIGPRAIYLRPICKGGHFNRGEGIEMALEAGAAPCGDFGSYHAEPIDPRSGISEPSVFIFPYGILVNKAGERFTNEAPGTVDATYEPITRQIFAQREGIAYAILDQKHLRIPNYRLAIRTDQPPILADSVNALAALLEIPAETLLATIKGFNAACPRGSFRPLELDGLATQGLDPPKSHWSVPLDEPPFHAYPIISSNVLTFGGVKVDARARVLDRDGVAMRGLYASGEVVGLYWRNYTGATSVLKGLVFGRLAGLDATGKLKG